MTEGICLLSDPVQDLLIQEISICIIPLFIGVAFVQGRTDIPACWDSCYSTLCDVRVSCCDQKVTFVISFQDNDDVFRLYLADHIIATDHT